MSALARRGAGKPPQLQCPNCGLRIVATRAATACPRCTIRRRGRFELVPTPVMMESAATSSGPERERARGKLSG